MKGASDMNQLFEGKLDSLFNEIGIDKVIKNGKSADLHDGLMNTFGDVDSKRQYPDYYGGAYINKNDDYIINVVEGSELWKENLKSRIDLTNVGFNTVKYTYKKLLEVRNDTSMMIKEEPFCKNYIACGIDNESNKVNVYAIDTDSEMQKDFLSRVSIPDIYKFVKSDRVTPEATTIYSGGGTQEGSIAYRAKLGTTVGVITAAHNVPYLGYLHTTGGSSFAQCIYRTINYNADAAFCSITDTSAYVPSNTIDSIGATLGTVLSDPPQNALVYKHAFGLSGYTTTYGYVSDPAYQTSITDPFDIYSTYSVVDLTLASYQSEFGNSGGLIFRIGGVSPTVYTVGVHHGSISAGAVYSKASNIAGTLGVVRY